MILINIFSISIKYKRSVLAYTGILISTTTKTVKSDNIILKRIKIALNKTEFNLDTFLYYYN